MRLLFQRGLCANIADTKNIQLRYDSIVFAIQSRNLFNLRHKIAKERELNTEYFQDIIKKTQRQINTADMVRFRFLQ